ncbi:class II fructose-bisphosphate aldolase [Quadrisphaera sp. DSM 44207]|uniref:class II fructose-bisphosphate aldolase n=1 Tax=Quadrisphaera sp. DSM 44207 TaxID=1881057 RepID=UPI00088D15C5|nr:class II fructose-bisphosphate aldolase [Quadrisphaera sp. DSM 44207]SDQ37335.1 fructose-bisphosphate aldolase, class II [Quadrisphaera sp. DSM 44207]
MPVVPLKEIVDAAFAERYGVPAINVVNDLTLEGVLAGAVQARSPLIVQTSVKTVRAIGSDVLIATWKAMTAGIEVPVSLHLDHCPDRAVISECLAKGWNSVLFDAHELPVEENQRQTVEVVAEARRYGASVEGEIEGITGIEDGVGSDEASARQTVEVQVGFVRATGVDVFAPAIGNAHGEYRSAPVLDVDRVSDIVAQVPVPIALHGGTGLSDEAFTDLIARGCAKVNISTALKTTFMRSSLANLRAAEEKGTWDPPTLFSAVQQDVVDLTTGLARIFGSAGRAA